jgi:hypothetical protein
VLRSSGDTPRPTTPCDAKVAVPANERAEDRRRQLSKAALTHYRAAAGRTTNLPEQRYLTTQAARLKMESKRDHGRADSS